MRTNVKWSDIQPTESSFERLPEGAYIVRITRVKDDTTKEMLTLTYDVAEGEHAGFFNDAWSQTNEWSHQFSKWYGDNSENAFAAFLHQLQDSNPNHFSIVEWERQGQPVSMFEGLIVGAVMRKRLYTVTRGKRAGEDAESIEVGRTINADDVRTGNWKPMEPRDTRDKSATTTAAAQPPAPRVGQPMQVAAAVQAYGVPIPTADPYGSEVPF